jgi:putative oxidoreductase
MGLHIDMAAGTEECMFAQLARFTDLGLLLLRLMIGIVFFSSGWGHVRDPEERSKSIGMSKGFTIVLGLAEMAGSLGIFLECSHSWLRSV